jgi:hypothetical protein
MSGRENEEMFIKPLPEDSNDDSLFRGLPITARHATGVGCVWLAN